MEVKQIYAIMNTVTGEILGDSVVVNEDLSNIVDVGTAIFNGYPTYEEWINWFELDQPANMGKMAQYHFSHLLSPSW